MTDKLEISIDIKALAAEVAKHIDGERVNTPRYYTAIDSPLGKRLFIKCAKEGCFPSFKVDGRGKLLALREDVEAWIERQDRPPAGEPEADEVGRALGKVISAGKVRLTKKAG